MNDFVKDKLNQYKSEYRNKCFALGNWIARKNKDFSFAEALYCIYIFSGGDFEEITNVIDQLTEKSKVRGRTQVYKDADIDMIDIRRDTNGKLKVFGYSPNKEPIAKGQHMPRNPKIFRKSDDQVKKSYQDSEKKIMDFGKKVRELYPDGDNQYITHAMLAIKKYANDKKISPYKVIMALEKGRLKLKDESYNTFEIVAESVKGRTIVINENMLNELNDTFEMTEFKFYNNIKKFLSDLLADPVNAMPSELLLSYGFTRKKLLGILSNIGVIERDDKISDKDENGMPKDATMIVKFRVPRKNFNRKLNRLWIRFFERNLPPRKQRSIGDMEINEDGEGATSAESSGEFVQPMFGIQRRKMPVEVEEATATTTAGDYEYDVPFAGDKETLARKNGVGGSVSVNRV